MASPQNGLQRFAEKYGPWALVTGAAQGMGSAYAEALAQRRLHVVLVDKQEIPLRQVGDGSSCSGNAKPSCAERSQGKKRDNRTQTSDARRQVAIHRFQVCCLSFVF